MKRLFKKLSRRKIATFTLMIVIFVMSLGYAALSQYIEIEGMAMIDRSWIIAITDVQSSVTNGGVANSNTFINNTVTLNSTLPTSSSTVTYTITLENKGNIVAKFGKLHVIEDDNTSIIYNLTGVVEEETILSPGEKNTVTVTIKYKEGVTSTSDLNKSIMFTFDYIEHGTSSGGNASQGEGTSGVAKYIAYKPGDVVSLNPGCGAVYNFYVISTDDTIYNPTVKLVMASSQNIPRESILQQNFMGFTMTWTRGVPGLLSLEDVAKLSGFKYEEGKDYEGQKTVGANYLGNDSYNSIGIYVDPGYYLTINGDEGVLSKSKAYDYFGGKYTITVDKGYLQQYASYEVGEDVTLLDGTEWIVVKDSASHESLITLFSKASYGKYAFDSSGTNNKYDPSSPTNIGYVIDNTIVPQIKESLDNYGGNTVGITGRLITENEWSARNFGEFIDETWIMGFSDVYQSTMTSCEDNGLGSCTNIGYSSGMHSSFYSTGVLHTRPVITVSKDNIQNIMMGYQLTLDPNYPEYYATDLNNFYSNTHKVRGLMVYFNDPSIVVEEYMSATVFYMNTPTIKVLAGSEYAFFPLDGEDLSEFAYLSFQHAYNNNPESVNKNNIKRVEMLVEESTTTITGPKPVTVYFGTPNPTSLVQYSFDNGTTWQNKNYKQYSENVSDYIKIKSSRNENAASLGMPYTITGVDKNPVVKITRTSGTLGYNNWYRTAVGLKIDATGLEGISTINYCTTTGASSCTPNTKISSSSTTLTISNYNATTVVCANATSTTGVTGATVCNTYKIDTIAPYISNYNNVLANATIVQTNSSGTDVGATMTNKTCNSATATCSALICLRNVTGKMTISGVQIAGADALSGYYSYSSSNQMYDKNGNATSGCLITQSHNPCTWKWTYTYRDYAGNTNKVDINYTVDYKGYNACA